MIIRHFFEHDRSEVIKLWNLCGLYRPVNDPSKDIDRKIHDSPELFLVAEISGKIVGSVMIGYDGHRGWINYLGVHPDFRRQKIATKLIDEAVRILSLRGCPKINLNVLRSNSEVVPFYESIGFKMDDVICMSKRLVND
jgi:ribosomal protein S18 acetylase RimI-like enzyme